MSVERGVGAGVGVYLLFQECRFRVRVRPRDDNNPNPNITLILTLKQYSLKKKIDPQPRPRRRPCVLLTPGNYFWIPITVQRLTVVLFSSTVSYYLKSDEISILFLDLVGNSEADPGEGPGGPRLSLFLDQTEAWKVGKKIFKTVPLI